MSDRQGKHVHERGSRGLGADLHRGDGVAFLAADRVQRVGEAQREDRVGVDREVPQIPPEPAHPPRLLPAVAAASRVKGASSSRHLSGRWEPQSGRKAGTHRAKSSRSLSSAAVYCVPRRCAVPPGIAACCARCSSVLRWRGRCESEGERERGRPTPAARIASYVAGSIGGGGRMAGGGSGGGAAALLIRRAGTVVVVLP